MKHRFHAFGVERWIRGSACPRDGDEEREAQRRSIERRLSREADLARREPSLGLRQRTLNAIYDLEFHRRYRHTAWWRTTRGGSALVAACVLLAGGLFGLMTMDGPSAVSRRHTHLASAPSDNSFAAAEVPSNTDDAPRPLEFVEDSIELAARAAPEWVLRALAPPAIREELSAMANGARRAADYIVSRLSSGGEANPAGSAPHVPPLPAPPLSDH